MRLFCLIGKRALITAPLQGIGLAPGLAAAARSEEPQRRSCDTGLPPQRSGSPP